MLQSKILSEHYNNLHKELLNLFHSSGMPMHFNKTGDKRFNNYQRISLIILLRRSKKSLRDFIDELRESRWTSWLGLKKIPGKSTLHDWIKLFEMKTIRQLFRLLRPKESKLTAIDGTGFDSWQRSRQYAKRIGEPPMPYAKVDLFVDVDKRMILDFSLVCKHQHDIIAAKQIFKKFKIRNSIVLADGAYDCEELHEIIRDKGGVLYAPVRKKYKNSLRKRPRGFYRRKCVELPEFMGQRSIIEAINASIKKKHILSLTSKKVYLKQREFAWHMIVYNLRRITEKSSVPMEAEQKYFFVLIRIYAFPDIAAFS